MKKIMPSTAFQVSVLEIVGDPICVAQDDGQRVFEVLLDALEDGREVSLSFAGVQNLTTAFLNAAVGQLLRHFDAEFLKTHLKARDLRADQVELLREVIERAKLYFQDKARFNAVRAQVLEV